MLNKLREREREIEREREEEMGETCRGGACGEGVGGGEACEECVQKCLLVHGRKNPSPIVTSFFKIIMDDLPKALFIPPRFARTIASLVNQETYLEDANGQRWKVKLSMLDGSLAFLQGWREFASDHSLVTGDFVLFYYILESHFVVQIYSRTGCEKFKISEKKNNIVKRKLSAKRPLGHLPSGGRKSSTTKPLSPMFRSDSFHEQGSTSTVHSDFEDEIYENNSVVKDVEEHVTVAAETTSVCKNIKTAQSVQQEECFEIPFYMFDRNAVDTQQEANRSSFFDLSNFEMIQSRPGADGRGTLSTVIKEEKFPCYDIDSVQPQTKEACCDISERKRKAKDGEELSFANEGILHFMDTSKQPSTCSKNEKTNLNTPTKASRKYPSTKGLNCMPEGTDKAIVQRGHTPAEKRHRSIPPVASMSRCPKNRSSTKEKDYYSGREPVAFEVKHEEKVKEKEGKPPVVVKMECEEIDNHLMKLEGQTLKVVKTESVDSVSLPAPIVVDFRISATAESQSFLELPTGLPSFTSKGRPATDRRVVLLRDPAMRKWPVLYHERNGFRVFASGWEALARENNIQIGDICNVVLENESEYLLQIHIDRNPSLVN